MFSTRLFLVALLAIFGALAFAPVPTDAKITYIRPLWQPTSEWSPPGGARGARGAAQRRDEALLGVRGEERHPAVHLLLSQTRFFTGGLSNVDGDVGDT